MPDLYSANQGWTLQATGDTNWGTVLNTILGSIDGLGAVGPLSVQTAEHPTSTSLNVKVSAGSYRKSDGTIVAYGGATSVTMTASLTNYLYLTDAGVLTVNTTGFPANTNIVPLATVVAGASTITSITDSRLPWLSFGQQLAIFANQSANTALMGPTSGAAAAPTFRTFVDADLASTHAALTTTLSIFAGGFGVFRRVPGSYPYTVLGGDGWVEVDSTSARTVNLPAANTFSAGECITVLDGNGHAGTNAVTIAPHGTDTINGTNASIAISANFGWAELYSDGTSNWHALQPGSGGGGGSVTSASNADGSLTISPTSGAVVASINEGHSNTWTAAQVFAPSSTTATAAVVNSPLGTTVPVVEFQINGTNVLFVNSKGSVVCGNGTSALATNATDGFIYVPTCAGMPTGTPTAETGTAALVINSSGSQLWANTGSGWFNLTPSVGTVTINTTVVSGGTSGYILYNNAGTVGNEQFVPCAHGGTGLDTSAAANGQFLIGNGGGFSLAALTAGANITITPAAGGCTIAASSSTGITVGTTTVASGTSGDLLYDNAGTLGNVGLSPGMGITASITGGNLAIGRTALHTVTDGATDTFDMSVSDLHTTTLGGNRTLAVTNVSNQPFTVILQQDATGGRTVTWWSTIRWVGGGTAPTLTTTANKADVFTFIPLGGGNYLGFTAGLDA